MNIRQAQFQFYLCLGGYHQEIQYIDPSFWPDSGFKKSVRTGHRHRINDLIRLEFARNLEADDAAFVPTL